MTQNYSQNTTPAKVVYLDRGGLPKSLTLRELTTPSDWINYSNTLPEKVIERAHTADVLVINKVAITPEILHACPSIKHIAISATGYDIVDARACQEHGVSVSNVPDYANISVPEHVINITLSLRRKLFQYRQQVIDGHWQNSPNFCLFDQPINDVAGCTFGVIGFGRLGRATAKLANALGMRVIYASRSKHDCDFAHAVDFSELIQTADIISLHCGLTPETKNLISTTELESMRDSAILINTARGGVADETAVAKAVENGNIAGIGFDVLVDEPPVNGSALLELAARSNVIITPHTAWASEQATQRLADILIDNIDAFLIGKPQNLVI